MFFILVCSFGTNAIANDNIQSTEAKVNQPALLTMVVDQPVQKLADIKKIFVATLGDGRGAELIRQRIINKLTESGHIVVVESAAEADATFNGFARLHRYSFYDDLVTSESSSPFNGKE